MGCCFLALTTIVGPRIIMILLFLFTNWFYRAFNSFIWPLLGFLLMPYTTLVYTLAMVFNHHSLTPGWLVFIIIAVIVDLGGQGISFKKWR